MRFLLLTISLFVLINGASCYGQFRERKSYDFMNTVILGRQTPGSLFLSDRMDFAAIENLDSIFSQKYINENNDFNFFKVDTVLSVKDLAYMRKQARSAPKTKTWDRSRLRKSNLIVDAVPPGFLGGKTYSRFSWPLFNRKGDVVLIYVESFCGIDCGGGSWKFLRRSGNGTWKPVGSLGLWIS